MKNNLQRFAIWLSLLSETLQTVLVVALFSVREKFTRKQSEDISETVVVVGNGPSAGLDIPYLVNMKRDSKFSVCAVNDFACSDVFVKLRPDIYILADPNYWLAEASKEVQKSRERLLSALNGSVSWKMKLYMPYDARGSSFVRCLHNDLIVISYYNRIPIRGFDSVCSFFIYRQAGMYPAFNVLIAALHVVIWLSFKRIIIIGADHSWHEEVTVSSSGEALVEQKHFYKEETKPATVKRPDGTFNIGELFVRWGEVFKIYHRIAAYAARNGIKIINSSSKSYIDAFQRAALRDVILK